MNEGERDAYIAYRIDRAGETIEEARLLSRAGKLRGAVNRGYYAMFYAVGALALSRAFSTSSHGQLRGFFNREFVKTGLVPVDIGRAYGSAFDNRSKGDYQDLVQFDAEQVAQMLSDAERLIEACKTLLAEEKDRD